MTLHKRLLLAASAAALLLSPLAAAHAADAVKLAGETAIPGYEGDFDHFDVDVKGDRLFLAGEEGKTLEVFKLSTGQRIVELKGLETPHSLLWLPKKNELLVIDGEKGLIWRDGKTLKVKRVKALGAASADSAAYDPASGRLFVVTGGKDVSMPVSFLNAVDPNTGRTIWVTKFASDHVEALAVEAKGGRIFINDTARNELAVLDKATGKVLKSVKVKEAEQNAPIALDETTHRLFVVTRKPGKLIVMNADTLATLAEFAAPGRTDQVTWDPVNRRVYVTGGEGYVSVVEQIDADHYAEVQRAPSGAGAKTAILSPDAKRLYVAQSPGDTKALGKLIWFDISPR